MEKWRGTVVQLTVLAIIGALAWREPKYIEHAFMLLGAVLGANVTGAKVSAAFASMMGGGGNGSSSGGTVRPPPMPPGASKAPPPIIGMLIGAFGAGVLGYFLTSCASAQFVPTDADFAAAKSYTADLVACVELAQTLEESKACRAKVRERYGVVETTRKDGGQ